MKRLIVALLFLFAPCSVWAAAISTAQDGEWSSTSTWTGGVVPGNGDTVTIATGHDVTVSDNRTVGTAGATGTEAIQVQGTGTLTVSAGSTLTVKGGLNQQRGTTITISGTLVLDAASGVTYEWKALNTGSGNAIMRISGTSSTDRALVTIGTGGGIGRFQTNGGSFFYTDINFQNGIVKGLGTSTVTAMDNYIAVSGQHNIQTNMAWVECGEVIVTAAHGPSGYIWNNVDFRNPTDSGFLSISASVAKTTGTRTINNLTNYKSTGSTTLSLNAFDTTINGMYLYNTIFSVSTYARSMNASNILYLADAAGVTFNIGLRQAGNMITDIVSLLRYPNQHHLQDSATLNAAGVLNTISGLICDGDDYYSIDAGDCVSVFGPLKISNSINLNKGGTLASITGANAITDLENNTVYGSYHTAVGETAGSASQIRLFRNNISASLGSGLKQISAFVSQTDFTLSHNAYYDMTTSTNIDYLGQNTYLGEATFNPWWSSGAYGDPNKGSDDIYVNPMFYDTTRTVRKFGGWGTVAATAEEMVTINGVDKDGVLTTVTTKRVQHIKDYIRKGFTPQNLTLKTAGYGGTYIGAVEPQLFGNGAALLLMGH